MTDKTLRRARVAALVTMAALLALAVISGFAHWIEPGWFTQAANTIIQASFVVFCYVDGRLDGRKDNRLREYNRGYQRALADARKVADNRAHATQTALEEGFKRGYAARVQEDQ